MWAAVTLSLGAVAYNNIVNLWPPFHRGAYIPLNLTFASAMTFVAVLVLGLPATQLAVGGDIAAAAVTLLIVMAFGVGATRFAHSRHGHRIADRRVAGLRGAGLAYHLLARIPLGTAVTEEVLFRGVLFATWQQTGVSSLGAAVASSLVFGLWHITPTIIGVWMNDPDPRRGKLWGAAMLAVVATTAAGLFLTWLRLETGGLLVPSLLHAGINSMGALAAVLAGRRS